MNLYEKCKYFIFFYKNKKSRCSTYFKIFFYFFYNFNKRRKVSETNDNHLIVMHHYEHPSFEPEHFVLAGEWLVLKIKKLVNNLRKINIAIMIRTVALVFSFHL